MPMTVPAFFSLALVLAMLVMVLHSVTVMLSWLIAVAVVGLLLGGAIAVLTRASRDNP